MADNIIADKNAVAANGAGKDKPSVAIKEEMKDTEYDKALGAINSQLDYSKKPHVSSESVSQALQTAYAVSNNFTKAPLSVSEVLSRSLQPVKNYPGYTSLFGKSLFTAQHVTQSKPVIQSKSAIQNNSRILPKSTTQSKSPILSQSGIQSKSILPPTSNAQSSSSMQALSNKPRPILPNQVTIVGNSVISKSPSQGTSISSPISVADCTVLNIGKTKVVLHPKDQNTKSNVSRSFGAMEDSLTGSLFFKTNTSISKYPTPPADIANVIDQNLHKCDYCGDSFAFRSSLKLHLSRKTMFASFYCKVCVTHVVIHNKCMLNTHKGCLRKLKFSDFTIRDQKDTTTFIDSDVVMKETLSNLMCFDTWEKEVSATNVDKPEITPNPPPEEFKASGEDINNAVDGDDGQKMQCEICLTIWPSRQSLKEHFTPKVVKEIYVCDHKNCRNKFFPTRCALNAHKTLHTQQPPFVCPECGELVNGSFEIFMKHVHKKCLHHSRALFYVCDQCVDTHMSADDLLDHIVEKHTEDLHKCKTCPMAFTSSESCDSHLQTVHKLDQEASLKEHKYMLYKCHLSEKPTVFTRRDMFKQHITAHIYNQLSRFLYKCQICHTSIFQEKADLMTHLLKDHSVLPIAEMCSYCGTEHSCKDNLDKHITACHSQDPKPAIKQDSPNTIKTVYKCPKCMFIFLTQPEVIYHLQTCHPIINSVKVTTIPRSTLKPLAPNQPPPSVRPPVPSVKPSLPSSPLPSPPRQLKQSAFRMDEEDKRFGCPVCKRRFNNRQWFMKHISRHEVDENYVCRQCCNVYFNEYSDLIDHQATCKPRRKRRALYRMRQIHNSEHVKVKSEDGRSKEVSVDETDDDEQEADDTLYRTETFDCEQCEEVFESWTLLKEHMKAGHGVTPRFSCQLCGLAYEDSVDLQEHTKRVHEGKGQSYRCYVCHEAGTTTLFDKRFFLERHLVGAHKILRVDIDEDKIFKVSVSLDNGRDVIEEGDLKMSMSDTSLKSDASPQSLRKLRIDGDNMFNCAKCDFSSEDRKGFSEHIAVHKLDEESIQCRECGTCFMVQPALKRHLYIVHKIKNFDKYYENVGVNYDNQTETEVLLPAIAAAVGKKQSKRKGDPFECQVCYKSCENEATLRNHMRTHGVAFIRSKRLKVASDRLSSSLNKTARAEEEDSADVPNDNDSMTDSNTELPKISLENNSANEMNIKVEEVIPSMSATSIDSEMKESDGENAPSLGTDPHDSLLSVGDNANNGSSPDDSFGDSTKGHNAEFGKSDTDLVEARVDKLVNGTMDNGCNE